jgi:hypothetical protein
LKAVVEERPFQGRVTILVQFNAALKAPLFHEDNASGVRIAENDSGK